MSVIRRAQRRLQKHLGLVCGYHGGVWLAGASRLDTQYLVRKSISSATENLSESPVPLFIHDHRTSTTTAQASYVLSSSSPQTHKTHTQIPLSRSAEHSHIPTFVFPQNAYHQKKSLSYTPPGLAEPTQAGMFQPQKGRAPLHGRPAKVKPSRGPERNRPPNSQAGRGVRLYVL